MISKHSVSGSSPQFLLMLRCLKIWDFESVSSVLWSSLLTDITVRTCKPVGTNTFTLNKSPKRWNDNLIFDTFTIVLEVFDSFLISFFQEISNIRQFIIWSRCRIGRFCLFLSLIVFASIILAVDQWNYLDKGSFLAVPSSYILLSDQLLLITNAQCYILIRQILHEKGVKFKNLVYKPMECFLW